MLKPIHRVNCSPALMACQQLMRRFALWICDPAVTSAGLTQAEVQAHMGSLTEGDWLWGMIAGATGKKVLLDKARRIADLQAADKLGLAQWVNAVCTIDQHFDAVAPAALPFAPPNGWGARAKSWSDFKSLMVAFYEEGLREGLPYEADGTPTANQACRVTYDQFNREFRAAHRLDPHPDAREVCVLCGGELVQPAVDHWLANAHYPLFAVCADNLLPICAECNEAPQKGQKPVHTNGSFADWFHPYRRHANGTLQPRYDAATLAIRIDSATVADTQKVRNLDKLLDLTERWTRDFKAEYRRLQRDIQQRGGMSVAQLQQRFTEYRDGLSPAEPHHEIHLQVADAMLEPARLRALAQMNP